MSRGVGWVTRNSPAAGALQGLHGCSGRDNAAGPRRDAGEAGCSPIRGVAPPRRGAALAPSNRSQLCCYRNTPGFCRSSLRVPRAQPLPSPGTALHSPDPASCGCPALGRWLLSPGRAGGICSCPLLPPARWLRASRSVNELAGTNNCMRSTFGCSAC